MATTANTDACHDNNNFTDNNFNLLGVNLDSNIENARKLSLEPRPVSTGTPAESGRTLTISSPANLKLDARGTGAPPARPTQCLPTSSYAWKLTAAGEAGRATSEVESEIMRRTKACRCDMSLRSVATDRLTSRGRGHSQVRVEESSSS